MRIPTATSGYTNHGTSIRVGNCAVKIDIVNELTNPTITLRGMNRINSAITNEENRPTRSSRAEPCGMNGSA